MRNNNRITKPTIRIDIQLFTLHLIGICFHLNISLLNIDNTETKGAPAFAVKAITTQAQMLEDGANGVSVKNQKLTLIPYYAWNHRGADQMNVWFVQSLKMLDK